MKKLFFTMIFVSVISLFGISKASALPVGGHFENWDSQKVFLGHFYSNTGAAIPFYGYNGTGSMSCPYLDGVSELAPLFCYNGKPYRTPGSGSSYLINSYPFCTEGDCFATNSIVNITYILTKNTSIPEEDSTLKANTNYTVTLDFGVNPDYFATFSTFLNNASGFQAHYPSTVTNQKVSCKYANDSDNLYRRDYCSFTYDITTGIDMDVLFIDFSSGLPLAELEANINWMLYPLIVSDPVKNMNKYTMKANQYAFISGEKIGSVYMPDKYYLNYDLSYINYFDINRDTQPYSSYINEIYFSSFFDYMYYDYDISSFSGAELVMLSTNAWVDYPYKTIEFYVSKNAYVDIVSFNPVGNVGNTLTFNYKNPSTGSISKVSVNSFTFDSQSGTLFANIRNGLDLFKDSILNVGTIYSEFYNNTNTSLGWFYLVIFSIGVLAIMLALFL